MISRRRERQSSPQGRTQKAPVLDPPIVSPSYLPIDVSIYQSINPSIRTAFRVCTTMGQFLRKSGSAVDPTQREPTHAHTHVTHRQTQKINDTRNIPLVGSGCRGRTGGPHWRFPCPRRLGTWRGPGLPRRARSAENKRRQKSVTKNRSMSGKQAPREATHATDRTYR